MSRPDRTWHQAALDTAANVGRMGSELLPAAGAVIGSAFGIPGRLVGYGAGQGLREIVQHGAEIPGALIDIYNNLQSNDPAVRAATMSGARQGATSGGLNLIPGGRPAQAAHQSMVEGRPWTASAQGINAALDAASVGAATPIRQAFASQPVRSTIGTLLGIGGATAGSRAADIAAEKLGIPDDPRAFVANTGGLVGGGLSASMASPRAREAIASSPTLQAGLAGLGLAVADQIGVPRPYTTAMGGAAVTARFFNQRMREMRERKAEAMRREGVDREEALRREGVAQTVREESRAIADRNRNLAAVRASRKEETRIAENQEKAALRRRERAQKEAKQDERLAVARARQDARWEVADMRWNERAAERMQAAADRKQVIAERQRWADLEEHAANLSANERATALRAAEETAQARMRELYPDGFEALPPITRVTSTISDKGIRSTTTQVLITPRVEGVEAGGALAAITKALKPRADAIDMSRRRGLKMMELHQESHGIFTPDQEKQFWTIGRSLGWSDEKIKHAAKDPASLMGYLSAGGTGAMPGSTYEPPSGPRSRPR